MIPKDIEPLLKECEETVTDLLRLGNIEVACFVQGVINSINKLPEVERPRIERPRGEWIFDKPTGYWYCSNCEREPKDQDYMLPFCAWCGSDNRSKEGDEK